SQPVVGPPAAGVLELAVRRSLGSNPGAFAMRPSSLPPTVALAALITLALTPASVYGQGAAQAPVQAPAAAPPPAAAPAAPPPGPYKIVPITLPPALNDPTFEEFRKKLAELAKANDRAA